MLFMFFQVLSGAQLFKAQLSKSWITANFDCSLILFYECITKRFGTSTSTLTFQKTFSTNEMKTLVDFNRGLALIGLRTTGSSVILSTIQRLLLELNYKR